MKLYISALLLSMAQAQNTGLRARWEMANAVINYGSTGIFTLRFETASKDNYDAGLVTTFWDKRCKDTPDGINKQLGAGLVQDPDDPDGSTPKLEMVGAGTESRPELKFKVDTLLMVATTTDAEYSAERPYTQTGGKGVLEFCVRNGLGFTSNPSPAVDNSDTMYTNSYQEVNYIETLVKIEYDLAAGITVDGFNVAPKARVGTTQTEQYDEALEAYLCTGPQDPDYFPATHANYDLNDGVWIPKKTPQSGNDRFNQGSLINICLAIKADFITKGVRIKTVNSFDFERLVNNFDKVTSDVAQTQGEDVTLPGSLFQNAISAGSASANYLTSFEASQCANSIACDFASVLFAEFYATPGTVIGNGKATLRFLSNAADAPYKMADNHADCTAGGSYETILTEADCKAAKVYLETTSKNDQVSYSFTKATNEQLFGCQSKDDGMDSIMAIMWYTGASTQTQIESQAQAANSDVFCKRVDGDAAAAAADSGSDTGESSRRLGEGTVESRRLQDGAGQISAVVSIPVNGDVEGPGDLKTAGSATLGATVLASVAAVVGAIVLA